VLCPTPIEFSPLFVCQFKGAFTLRIRQAFPKGHRELSPIFSRELEKLGKWAGCHTVIVSRVEAHSQYNGNSRHCCLLFGLRPSTASHRSLRTMTSG